MARFHCLFFLCQLRIRESYGSTQPSYLFAGIDRFLGTDFLCYNEFESSLDEYFRIAYITPFSLNDSFPSGSNAFGVYIYFLFIFFICGYVSDTLDLPRGQVCPDYLRITSPSTSC